MKALKPTKAPNPNLRTISVTLKVNALEMRKLLANAHGLTRGNMSEWLRFAALNFKPSKKDFQK